MVVQMTADHLRTRKAKDLAQMARQAGISGWYGMRKAELIRALLPTSPKATSTSNGHSSQTKEQQGKQNPGLRDKIAQWNS